MSATNKLNALDLRSPRKELITCLSEAVEEQYRNKAQILVYRFGFLRLPFAKNRRETGKYLHIWSGELPQDDFPHRHSFRMRSRVLVGGLTNQLWKLEETPQGTHWRLRTVYLDNNKTTTEQVGGLVIPHLESEDTVHEDSLYEMSNDVYHTTIIQKDPTVTLAEKYDVEPDDQNSFKVTPITRTDVREHETDLMYANQDEAWNNIRRTIKSLT